MRLLDTARSYWRFVGRERASHVTDLAAENKQLREDLAHEIRRRKLADRRGNEAASTPPAAPTAEQPDPDWRALGGGYVMRVRPLYGIGALVFGDGGW